LEASIISTNQMLLYYNTITTHAIIMAGGCTDSTALEAADATSLTSTMIGEIEESAWLLYINLSISCLLLFQFQTSC